MHDLPSLIAHKRAQIASLIEIGSDLAKAAVDKLAAELAALEKQLAAPAAVAAPAVAAAPVAPSTDDKLAQLASTVSSLSSRVLALEQRATAVETSLLHVTDHDQRINVLEVLHAPAEAVETNPAAPAG